MTYVITELKYYDIFFIKISLKKFIHNCINNPIDSQIAGRQKTNHDEHVTSLAEVTEQ